MSLEHFRALSNNLATAETLIKDFGTAKVWQANVLTKLKCLKSKIDTLILSEITPETYTSSMKEFDNIVSIVSTAEVDLTPNAVISKYIERIVRYGYQGGFGHYVGGNCKFACHWVIYPSYYKLCKPVEIEQLCFFVDNRVVEIDNTPETEKWGN